MIKVKIQDPGGLNSDPVHSIRPVYMILITSENLAAYANF